MINAFERRQRVNLVAALTEGGKMNWWAGD